ncbi:DUF3397 domain-containing protein [Paucisalibacillus globulus]|uniref:DUF3397 domain-containing protein n=1 Tax=Paucisalibacillus globulus TaxID=351095 RepID=UPI0004274B1F|nr:DUF3397 domain-containing protein [Paucisalibacillus globulus]
MLDFLIVLLAFIITAPILMTILTYYSLKLIYQNPIKAFQKAISWTTIIYILEVNTMFSYLFGRSFLGYIIVLMLCVLTIVIVLQWKNNVEINYQKALKLLWRISFLIFFVLYIILVIIGIVKAILV